MAAFTETASELVFNSVAAVSWRGLGQENAVSLRVQGAQL